MATVEGKASQWEADSAKEVWDNAGRKVMEPVVSFLGLDDDDEDRFRSE